ncbi:MAG: DEAD/DEAH box helicase [Phycisphaerae bacterium]|nr:DEAD/DEAH box helicase [Phycisphaerae bacterium]
MRFDDFGLIEPILQAIEQEGYTDPTPIQVEAIPHVMTGGDLLGCAQTGTGKTAAFALPILHRLATHPHPNKKQDKHNARPIRTLVLSPTRELAAQIGDSFKAYGRNTGLKHTVVYGGVKQGPQTNALKKGVDILVATPGRLLDLMGQGHIHLGSVEIFVLDEADRMLDMGFINDIWRVVAELPKKRQTLFFSATMPFNIQTLANSILTEPIEVRLATEAPAAETVSQRIFLVERANKRALLEHLLKEENIVRALVFTRTKLGADRVVQYLTRKNLRAEAIHSDKAQNMRMRALENFKSGRTPILIASDIAARGIDIDDISHVFNFDMPNEPEVYIHRIGRTGRAGQTGVAYSFCSLEERLQLDEVEELLGQTIETLNDHPFPSPLPRAAKRDDKPKATGLYSHRRPSKRRRL